MHGYNKQKLEQIKQKWLHVHTDRVGVTSDSVFIGNLYNHREASHLSPAAMSETLPIRDLKQVHQTSHPEYKSQMSSVVFKIKWGWLFVKVQARFRLWRGILTEELAPYRGNGCIWNRRKFCINFSCAQSKGAKNRNDDAKTEDGKPKQKEVSRITACWCWCVF